MKINAYLTFDGRCEEAFKLYADVLGGRIEAMMPHKGTPAEEHVPPDWRDKIMHASLTVDGNVLMGSDSPPQFQQPKQGFSVSLHFADPADAERAFSALADGGTVRMPLAETFWAQRFGMLTDRFGTPWMVNCDRPA